jgi:hypothetical protein
VKSKVVPLRIPETLDSLAASCSQEQHTDKATTLRQWLYGRAAELLDMSIYDIYRIAQESGIELGATEEQHRQSMEHARRFMERTRARNA